MKNKSFSKSGFFFLVLGAAMIIAGVINSQHNDVFEKAVRICLECIGIG